MPEAPSHLLLFRMGAGCMPLACVALGCSGLAEDSAPWLCGTLPSHPTHVPSAGPSPLETPHIPTRK